MGIDFTRQVDAHAHLVALRIEEQLPGALQGGAQFILTAAQRLLHDIEHREDMGGILGAFGEHLEQRLRTRCPRPFGLLTQGPQHPPDELVVGHVGEGLHPGINRLSEVTLCGTHLTKLTLRELLGGLLLKEIGELFH